MNTYIQPAGRDVGKSPRQWTELVAEHIGADRFDAAAESIARARRTASGPSSVSEVVDRQRCSAALHLAAGRVDLAAAVAEAALELLGHGVGPAAETALRAVLAVAAARRGDTAAARREVALLPGSITGRAARDAAEASMIVAGLQDDRSVGVRAAATLVRAFRAGRPTTVDPSAVVALARHHVAHGGEVRMTSLAVPASRGAGPVSAAGAAVQVRGILRSDPRLLQRAVQILRAGARPLVLAEALVDAAAAEPSIADGRELVAEAVEIFTRCGAAGDARRAWSRLRGGNARGCPPRTDGLSSAELRVARLVAEGFTNRRVASRLRLSPHTVDSHLRNIFGKLDISSRVELARRLPVLPATRSA